jgi:hypothetical protein
VVRTCFGLRSFRFCERAGKHDVLGHLNDPGSNIDRLDHLDVDNDHLSGTASTNDLGAPSDR